jgi:hypothetical protein
MWLDAPYLLLERGKQSLLWFLRFWELVAFLKILAINGFGYSKLYLKEISLTHWMKKFRNQVEQYDLTGNNLLQRYPRSIRRVERAPLCDWSSVFLLLYWTFCHLLVRFCILVRKGFMKELSVFWIHVVQLGRSSSSVRHRPHAAKIAGSNPARPILLVFLL